MRASSNSRLRALEDPSTAGPIIAPLIDDSAWKETFVAYLNTKLAEEDARYLIAYMFGGSVGVLVWILNSLFSRIANSASSDGQEATADREIVMIEQIEKADEPVEEEGLFDKFAPGLFKASETLPETDQEKREFDKILTFSSDAAAVPLSELEEEEMVEPAQKTVDQEGFFGRFLPSFLKPSDKQEPAKAMKESEYVLSRENDTVEASTRLPAIPAFQGSGNIQANSEEESIAGNDSSVEKNAIDATKSLTGLPVFPGFDDVSVSPPSVANRNISQAQVASCSDSEKVAFVGDALHQKEGILWDERETGFDRFLPGWWKNMFGSTSTDETHMADDRTNPVMAKVENAISQGEQVSKAVLRSSTVSEGTMGRLNDLQANGEATSGSASSTFPRNTSGERRKPYSSGPPLVPAIAAVLPTPMDNVFTSDESSNAEQAEFDSPIPPAERSGQLLRTKVEEIDKRKSPGLEAVSPFMNKIYDTQGNSRNYTSSDKTFLGIGEGSPFFESLTPPSPVPIQTPPSSSVNAHANVDSLGASRSSSTSSPKDDPAKKGRENQITSRLGRTATKEDQPVNATTMDYYNRIFGADNLSSLKDVANKDSTMELRPLLGSIGNATMLEYYSTILDSENGGVVDTRGNVTPLEYYNAVLDSGKGQGAEVKVRVNATTLEYYNTILGSSTEEQKGVDSSTLTTKVEDGKERKSIVKASPGSTLSYYERIFEAEDSRNTETPLSKDQGQISGKLESAGATQNSSVTTLDYYQMILQPDEDEDGRSRSIPTEYEKTSEKVQMDPRSSTSDASTTFGLTSAHDSASTSQLSTTSTSQTNSSRKGTDVLDESVASGSKIVSSSPTVKYYKTIFESDVDENATSTSLSTQSRSSWQPVTLDRPMTAMENDESSLSVTPPVVSLPKEGGGWNSTATGGSLLSPLSSLPKSQPFVEGGVFGLPSNRSSSSIGAGIRNLTSNVSSSFPPSQAAWKPTSPALSSPVEKQLGANSSTWKPTATSLSISKEGTTAAPSPFNSQIGLPVSSSDNFTAGKSSSVSFSPDNSPWKAGKVESPESNSFLPSPFSSESGTQTMNKEKESSTSATSFAKATWKPASQSDETRQSGSSADSSSSFSPQTGVPVSSSRDPTRSGSFSPTKAAWKQGSSSASAPFSPFSPQIGRPVQETVNSTMVQSPPFSSSAPGASNETASDLTSALPFGDTDASVHNLTLTNTSSFSPSSGTGWRPSSLVGSSNWSSASSPSPFAPRIGSFAPESANSTPGLPDMQNQSNFSSKSLVPPAWTSSSQLQSTNASSAASYPVSTTFATHNAVQTMESGDNRTLKSSSTLSFSPTKSSWKPADSSSPFSPRMGPTTADAKNSSTSKVSSFSPSKSVWKPTSEDTSTPPATPPTDREKSPTSQTLTFLPSTNSSMWEPTSDDSAEQREMSLSFSEAAQAHADNTTLTYSADKRKLGSTDERETTPQENINRTIAFTNAGTPFLSSGKSDRNTDNVSSAAKEPRNVPLESPFFASFRGKNDTSGIETKLTTAPAAAEASAAEIASSPKKDTSTTKKEIEDGTWPDWWELDENPRRAATLSSMKGIQSEPGEKGAYSERVGSDSRSSWKETMVKNRRVLQDVLLYMNILEEFENVVPVEEIAQRKRELLSSWKTIRSSVQDGDVNIVSEDENLRRYRLQEVRQHLSLLGEFEGVVPADELTQRRRELFYALALPPPARAERE